MDRRKINKIVADLLPQFGGPAQLLGAIADGMREPAKAPPPLSSILKSDDALGQIYQAINAPALEAAYRATAADRRKFTPAEIPAVTQLFTPKWVVEFLLQNALGSLWLEIHPDSKLKKNWKWLIPENRSKLPASPKPARDFRICDPACGTMNFGLVALDMLREIYREEFDRAGQPGWPVRADCCRPADVDSQIIRDNLIGLDIDPIAVDLARRSLEIKIARRLGPKDHQLSVRDALFDPRIGGPFDVVVTNPPYLSARNLDAKVVRKLKDRFPSGWRDHYACFMLRSMELLRPGGRLGVLTMHSFMFTGAFERLRRELATQANVQTIAHFGPGLFDIGNPGTLQTAALVLRRKPVPETPARIFRLVDEADKRAALQRAIRSSSNHELKQSDLSSLPRSAWMYWISPPLRRAFADLPKLGDIAPPRQGLATTDNARFVRYWWEVEPPGFDGERQKWKPYAKGGRFRRWYESAHHRVNWEDDGREIKQAIVERYPYLNGQWQWVAKNSTWYGRPGITYSYLTSGAFSARRLEAGTFFDVAGSSLFPEDPLAVLGILNSTTARQILSAINPTVNFQVGDLRQLPIPASIPDELRQAVASAIESTRKLDCFDETSVDFAQPEPWIESNSADLRAAVADAERSINRITADLYGARHKSVKGPCTKSSKEDLARRWLSYALGVWLGRWSASPSGEIALLRPLDETLRRDLSRILADRAGENSAVEIAAEVGGLERFFACEFLPWHNLIYRGRPNFWGFTGNGRTIAVHGQNARPHLLRRAFGAIGQTLPANWPRAVDDGVRINLAPLCEWIADRKLAATLGEIRLDLERGRFSFSQTAREMYQANRGSTVNRGSTSESGSSRRRYRRRISPASTGR